MSLTFSNPFENDAQIASLRKEVIDYQKCILGNYIRLIALTEIVGLDGYHADPESCTQLPSGLVQKVLRGLVERLLIGLPLKGGYNAWSVGDFGSRWIDLDPLDFGSKGEISHIRCAFYSKKATAPGNWEHEKPFYIRVMVEKERR